MVWWDIWPLAYCSDYNKLAAESVWKNFSKSLNIWQSYGEKLSASTSSALHERRVLVTKKSSLEIRRKAGRNCCNSVTLRLTLLTIPWLRDRQETGVMSTCFARRFMPSVTERVLCAGVMLRRFSWGCAFSRPFCGVFGLVTSNTFSSVNKNDANIIGWIFLNNRFKWQSLNRLYSVCRTFWRWLWHGHPTGLLVH